MRDEAVGEGRGDVEVTPTLGRGAPKDPVLPFCLFREHSNPRDG